MVAIQEGTLVAFAATPATDYTGSTSARHSGAAERGLALVAARHRERAQVIAALGERIRALATDPALATQPIEHPLEALRNSNKG
jgi:hypothetical protein